MANQLHYPVDRPFQENIAKPFLLLPTDQLCLIDDCFDEAIEQTNNQSILNDVA